MKNKYFRRGYFNCNFLKFEKQVNWIFDLWSIDLNDAAKINNVHLEPMNPFRVTTQRLVRLISNPWPSSIFCWEYLIHFNILKRCTKIWQVNTEKKSIPTDNLNILEKTSNNKQDWTPIKYLNVLYHMSAHFHQNDNANL